MSLTGFSVSAPGRAGELASRIGELAAAFERAHEFPGKVSDAERLKYRLLIREAQIAERERACEREALAARAAGREFSARKLAAEIAALEEERLDAAVMLAEVDRVLQRLRRERRALLYRLDEGEALLAAFPAGHNKASLRQMLEEARRRLVSRRIVGSAASDT